QLTDMKEGACQPAWSPGGNRVVFVSPCAVQQDVYRGSSLYVVNEDGSGLRPLNTVPGGDFEPDWSPDGRYIAFTSVRTGHMQIYSYDLESNITQRLIRTPRAIDARQPAWSPDGKQIAFVERGTQEAYEIWIMSNLGRDPYALVRSGAQYSDMHPEWSPDGKIILFNQSPTKKFGFPRLLTISLEPNSDPVPQDMKVLSINNVDFSSDGLWLAFEFRGERGTDVYYMTPSGAGKTEVSPSPADDFDPTWRPVPKP
ncbi:MAG: TolB family protein, partial [Bacteroidota bacterium]